MKQRSWIAISGCTWMAIGGFLLYKGLHLIAEATSQTDSFCSSASTFFGTAQQAGTFLIAVGLLIGFLKGRFVLSKTVQRVASRIASLSSPVRVSDVYASSYLILIGSMILLGVSLRFLPIPIDIRGLVDVAIGSALLNGSTLYFRFARNYAPSR